MANADYTYDQVKNGTGLFRQESGMSYSVRRLQTKLKRNGYLNGSADGYYGAQTAEAVKLLQSEAGLSPDGVTGQRTLMALDNMDNEPVVELYGRELTHSELLNGYSSSMSEVEAIARCIYGEDTAYSDGQSAVAEEIYNRKVGTQYSFGSYTPINRTRSWKAVVYDPGQYSVMSHDDSGSTSYSRRPNQYSAEWANCVALAQQLVDGGHPNILGKRYFHMAAEYPIKGTYYNYVQIPKGKGNQFYNNSTTKF